MKKLITITVAALSAALVFADLYPSKRWTEIGFNTTLGANQNLITLPDVLNETIKIDFTQWAKNLNGEDFLLRSDADLNVFAKFQFGPIGGGVEVGIDNDIQFGIDDGVFTFLGYGNASSDSDTIKLGLGAGLQSFATVDLLARFKVGRLGFTARPTAFLPLAYMPYSTATFSLSYDDTDGYYLSSGEGSGNNELPFYCPLNLGGAFSAVSNINGETLADFANFDVNSLLSSLASGVMDILSQTGFNLSAEVEYPIFNTLDVGVFTRVPIVPARLKYGSAAYVRLKDKIVFGQISDVIGGTMPEISMDNFEYGINLDATSELENGMYTVNMPFRLGMEGAWRPFGGWLTFRPMFGFGTRNPFGKDTQGWQKFWANTYLEYGLGAEFTILYILGLDFSHQYVDQVFTNSVGLRLNLRVLEVDLKLATSSSNFTKCWNVAGATAYVGVHVGI